MIYTTQTHTSSKQLKKKHCLPRSHLLRSSAFVTAVTTQPMLATPTVKRRNYTIGLRQCVSLQRPHSTPYVPALQRHGFFSAACTPLGVFLVTVPGVTSDQHTTLVVNARHQIGDSKNVVTAMKQSATRLLKKNHTGDTLPGMHLESCATQRRYDSSALAEAEARLITPRI